MPYTIAEANFRTKDAITEQCQSILYGTSIGSPVESAHLPFLLELFSHHTEWQEKSQGGVIGVTVQNTPHGTPCFYLLKSGGGKIDISFPHAIKHIPTARSKSLLPQQLLDFRNAARTAVRSQIYSFRDSQLSQNPVCPILGQPLTRQDCAIDHVAPKTFDQLLFDFCLAEGLNPINVSVSSIDGTVPHITDELVQTKWQQFHAQNAELRIVSRIANLQIPKATVLWGELWR